MTKSIEIIVSPEGALRIEAVNFQGADCEQATRFLEEALGVVAQKQRKSEFHQLRKTKQQQRT